MMRRWWFACLAAWLVAFAIVRAESDCFTNALARAGGAPALRGDDGWLYLTADLRFLSAGDFWGDAAADTGRAANPAHRDPLEPIDDFNRQLADRGIRLLVVPVPPKPLIYPSGLGCGMDDVRPALERLRQFYTLLRERRVEVLDLTEEFLSDHALAEGPLYCKTDTHWSGMGIWRAANRIAKWLREEGLIEDDRQTTYSVEQEERRIVGDLSRMLGSAEPETILVQTVKDAAGQPPRPSAESPILLLGDSHVLVFSEGGDLHGVGSGLPEALAANIGAPVDVLGVRGSGATTSRISLIRRIKSSPAFYSTKKVIVWCFAAREFTEADAWRFVPLPVQ